jgi:2-polyprenyl-6-methoxyphenol hydroxylase-like FAD-dependent oxidoreductase
VIAEKRFENGGEGMKGKGQLLLPQGMFQEVMLEMLEGGDVEVRRGWVVRGVVGMGKDSVRVEIEDGDGRTNVLEGLYLVAADGGKSVIRKGLGKSNNFECIRKGIMEPGKRGSSRQITELAPY